MFQKVKIANFQRQEGAKLLLWIRKWRCRAHRNAGSPNRSFQQFTTNWQTGLSVHQS